jgi:hypothetical protein
LSDRECPDFPTIPWIEGPPLDKGRLAIVLSGGLTVPATACSAAADGDHQAIPSAT